MPNHTSNLFSSAMDWTGGIMVFGAESGKLYLWESTTLKSIANVKGHGGEYANVTQLLKLT